MVIEENWGISLERIQQFLRAQPDVTENPDGFQFHSCKIHLTPTQGTLMEKWPHARTVIRIAGPDADAKQIHRRFFLQFLSAGG